MFWHVPALPFPSPTNAAALCGCVALCLPTPRLMAIWAVSTSWGQDSAAANKGAHFCADVCFHPSWMNIPRRGIAGSRGNSVFHFLRNCQTIFFLVILLLPFTDHLECGVCVCVREGEI